MNLKILNYKLLQFSPAVIQPQLLPRLQPFVQEHFLTIFGDLINCLGISFTELATESLTCSNSWN